MRMIASGAPRAADASGGVIDPAQLVQDEQGRTESGERRLDEVDANEHGQEDPAGVDESGQRAAKQDDGARENTDEGIGFHDN